MGKKKKKKTKTNKRSCVLVWAWLNVATYWFDIKPRLASPAALHAASCIVQAANSSKQPLLLISNCWQRAMAGSWSGPCVYQCATVGEQWESSAIFVPVYHLYNTPDWLSHQSLLINMQHPSPRLLLSCPKTKVYCASTSCFNYAQKGRLRVLCMCACVRALYIYAPRES